MAKSRRRRKRRRSGPPQAKPAAAKPRAQQAPAGASRRRAPSERPPAPWGAFPLVELMVLLGIVLLVWGAIAGGERGTTMIGVGIGLASLAGIELSVREHFSGYRSHTTLLAGSASVVTVALTFAFSGLVLAACLVAGAAVFALAFLWLRAAFRRASGGLSYRIGNLRG